MHEFAVWAPKPKKLAVLLNGKRYPMAGPDERGWWRTTLAAAPGDEYGFLLDDDTHPYPDPRSLRQPTGVHGLSAVYDHSAFRWSDATWQAPPLATAIVYELHVGTFTPEGTLLSAIERLDYLVSLGITHVELMPVAAFAGDRGWGYDGVALFAVTENYGSAKSPGANGTGVNGPDALKRFVDACHAKGLAVLLDVVYNHFGPVGNYTGKYAPYTTANHNTPWGDAVNFESEGSAEVRRFFCDNALMWLRDFHIDGLRLDAVHEFVDRSAIHFLEQLATEVAALGASLHRRFVLIAESDLNDPRVVTPRELGGHGIDAQWSDDFHHALFAVLHPGEQGYYADFGSMAQLAKALTRVFVYDGVYSGYRSRHHGRAVEGLAHHRFLGYIQNHDQIGNRAIGDRLEHIVGLDRAKVAAAIVLTSPFVPMLFQGEEFAASTPFQYFADHEDPEMAKSVSEGRKREFAAFGWPPESIPDPEQRSTFEHSKLNWKETTEGIHAEMLAWYRTLIHLRRTLPALAPVAGQADHEQPVAEQPELEQPVAEQPAEQPATCTVEFDEDRQWLQIDRGELQVIANLGDSDHVVELPADARLLACSRPGIDSREGKLTLPAKTVVLLTTAP